MRGLIGVSLIALSLALAGTAHAQGSHYFRLNMGPTSFTAPAAEDDGTPPDAGENNNISIVVDPAALVEGEAKGRINGNLSIPILVSGIDGSYEVEVIDLPAGAAWVADGVTYGSGVVSWAAATIGRWMPTILVRDSSGDIVATADLTIEILPSLDAAVPQTEYQVTRGDELTITPSVQNTIGDVAWSSTPSPLPDWLSLDTSTGAIDVDTASKREASVVTLTAVDQADWAMASTTPFSVKVDGFLTDFWVASLGGSSTDTGSGISAGADGSIYVSGYTQDVGAGGQDVLLAKYDAAGGLQWKKTLGGSAADQSSGIAAGADASVYVTGYTQNAGAGGQDVLLAKYDAAGALQWKKTLGGSVGDYGNGIAAGADGSVYVSGYTNGAPAGGSDLLLAKYNASGALQWQKTLGGSSADLARSVTVGVDGSVYVSGYTQSVTDGNSDLLVAKYNAAGTLQWKKTLGGGRTDISYGITIGSDGSVYVSGYTDSSGTGGFDVLIAKYSTSGALQWQRTLGGSGTDQSYGITAGADGSVYVSGHTQSAGAGDSDVLIAKYNASGALQWQRTLSGSGADYSQSITARADGSVYVTGFTQSAGAGGIDLLIARLPADGGDDMAAGPFTWQDANLAEGSNPALSETSPSWTSPDGALANGQNPTGLSESAATALSGTTTQFERAD